MNITISAENVEQMKMKLVSIAKELGYNPKTDEFDYGVRLNGVGPTSTEMKKPVTFNGVSDDIVGPIVESPKDVAQKKRGPKPKNKPKTDSDLNVSSIEPVQVSDELDEPETGLEPEQPEVKEEVSLAPSKEQIRDLMKELSTQKGLDAVVSLLAEFDASKLADLQSFQYGDFYMKLKAALE